MPMLVDQHALLRMQRIDGVDRLADDDGVKAVDVGQVACCHDSIACSSCCDSSRRSANTASSVITTNSAGLIAYTPSRRIASCRPRWPRRQASCLPCFSRGGSGSAPLKKRVGVLKMVARHTTLPSVWLGGSGLPSRA